MFYDYAITVPANTAETAPIVQVMKLRRGVITKVEVQFPIGTLSLLRCKIYHRASQAWPTNPDGYFASDGYVIPIEEYFELNEEPYELKVYAWNLDDTYQHVLTVRIGILPWKQAEPMSGLAQGIKSLLKLVGVAR